MGDPKENWPQIIRDIDDVAQKYGAGIYDVGHSPGHVTSGGSTLTPYKFHIRVIMPPKPRGEDWAKADGDPSIRNDIKRAAEKIIADAATASGKGKPLGGGFVSYEPEDIASLELPQGTDWLQYYERMCDEASDDSHELPDDIKWTPVKEGDGEKIKGKIEPQTPPTADMHIHYHIPAGYRLDQKTETVGNVSVTTVTVRPVK